MNLRLLCVSVVLFGTLASCRVFLFAKTKQVAREGANKAGDNRPWTNTSLSSEERAEMVLKAMTLDEKIDMLHGQETRRGSPPGPSAHLSNGGPGFSLGVPRLGIPILQMNDAAYGVRGSGKNGRYSTALPSNLGLAATWDTQAGCAYGALIGRELRAQGYNMSLAGGANLAREPRNGRTFEYMGEDPILAGNLVGHRIKCEQEQHIVGDIKHYALNDQESGRNQVDAVIGKRAMRESDLLAFEIGIEIGQPGAVMCSYNAVNGDYACENRYLLTDVLKKEWGFKGFVVSDWGATHSTARASSAGLDNEQPGDRFFGENLKQGVEAGTVPMAELDDHVRRILRSEFASGIIDEPATKSVVDVESGLETALRMAEHSIVLLKNTGVLPLDRHTRRIAIIGTNADTGMISGGGSAQVDPPGRSSPRWKEQVWFPTSPLKAVVAKVPGASVTFDSGVNPANAAAAAKNAEVAVVFAHQWSSEDMDLPNLSLPGNQDVLIQQVAEANSRTIVVLETGSAVTMPWLEKVSAVVEVWYAGSKGADAVANVLFGDVNPSAKLAITFPRSEGDLPHRELLGPPPDARRNQAGTNSGEAKPTFSVHYDEGMTVGYKWYDAQNKPVLFPFGYGLSYTTYSYAKLKVKPGAETSVSFEVKNTGNRAGEEIAEVYAAVPASAGEPPKRLVGWSKVHLNAGESKQVTVSVVPKYLSIYDEARDGWRLVPGTYTFMVGPSSRDLPLTERVSLP